MQAPDELDQAADDDRGAERHRQPGPDVVLEGLAADAADQERVERPDDRGDRGRGDESSARIADKPAGEGHRGPAAGDEAADDDELRSEPPERPLGPRAGPLALGRGEEPALDGGSEPAAEQVAEVVAEEGADGRAGHQQGDARVAASGGGDAEGDDRRLARQDREDRVERREGSARSGRRGPSRLGGCRARSRAACPSASAPGPAVVSSHRLLLFGLVVVPAPEPR